MRTDFNQLFFGETKDSNFIETGLVLRGSAGPELSELFAQILHEVAVAVMFGEDLLGAVDLD